jgi:hypothetical protein
MATVKERFHLVVLDGLELKNLDQVELGTISICRPDMKLLSAVQYLNPTEQLMSVCRIGIKCRSLPNFVFCFREIPKITEIKIG